MTIERVKARLRPSLARVMSIVVVVAAVATSFAHGWLVLSLAALLGGFWAAATILRLHRRQDVIELGANTVHARSRMTWIAAGAIAAATSLLIALVPPYQSPDAGTHMWRAYSLLDNRVLLKPATQGHPVNQLLDPAMFDHTQHWARRLAFKPDRRVDAAFARETDAMRWSGRNEPVYSAAVIYFPALYAPAALALGVGRGIDATLGTSVLAARLAMGLAAMVAVLLALGSTRAGFHTMCVTAMLPMSLWQFAGANLDTMTISIGLLVAALTTCGAYGRVPGRDLALPSVALLGAWALMAMLVVTKPVFLVYLLYPLWCSLRGQWRTTLLPTLVCMVLVVGWQLHVGRNYFEPRMVIDGTPLSNMVAALQSPVDTALVIAATLQGGYAIYWKSMLGILGWLDTPMSASAYVIASTALLVAACADALSRNALGNAFRVLMLLAAAAYFVGIFLFLLVAWTPEGSERIVGVQGRYFLQVLPVAAMALGLRRDHGATRRLPWAFAIGMVVYALWTMWYLRHLVLARYWQ